MPDTRSADAQSLLHRALADPSRVSILERLRHDKAPRDARELAEAVGLHVNTVRSHLRQLSDAGLVCARPDAQGKPGRPHIVFEATERPAEGPEALAAYRMLTGVLLHAANPSTTAADAESAALAAARELDTEESGTRDRGPVDRVARLLARLGFDPELSRSEAGTGDEIVMRACPFEDLGPDDLEIACSMHRGLIRGALRPDADDEAPETIVELDREPGSCVARLAATG
jgi:predicted ArsR family transcriptional regulator